MAQLGPLRVLTVGGCGDGDGGGGDGGGSYGDN